MMKLLSLHQPWASAMAIGLKTIETRGKRCNYRGMVAIHAAKRWDHELSNIATGLPSCAVNPLCDAFWETGKGWKFPLGQIVAIGRIVDCLPTQPGFTSIFEQWPRRRTKAEETLGNYDAGRFGWVFHDVHRLREPLPYRGSQCMLDLPVEVEAELMGRLA